MRDLSLSLRSARPYKLVEGVSFDVPAGGVLGIVGESGCGKSVTAMSLLRLNSPAIELTGGQILFGGEDLVRCSDDHIREVRGAEISMIFQEPMTSLNPVFTVGSQIVEALQAHENISEQAARKIAVDFLGHVGIPSPRARFDNFPHQLSGGMRQRAMIAMALVCKPQLLIADEPTTALDVTIQAQILDLLRRLRAELGMAVIMITHNLGVIADIADRVVVMYAGRVVERASVGALFDRPAHPYTEGLLGSVPPLDRDVDRLPTIVGTVPSPQSMPAGCRFAGRCRYVEDACKRTDPVLLDVGHDHAAACIRHSGYGV
ncbi:MAG: ABC transporter ATP-binding protein [Burkholderiaceae bacterium]|nr:ABC transporter ATP-binding protein [Burkholderiaceae bacterium]